MLRELFRALRLQRTRRVKMSHCVRRFRKLLREALEERTVLTAYFPPSQFIYSDGGFLSQPDTAEPLDIALSYLDAHAADFGLTAADVAAPLVTDLYTDDDTGITHVYLRQQVNGLEVANANIGIHISSLGQVISAGGGFVPGLTAQLEAGLLPLTAALGVEDAVRTAATIRMSQPLKSVRRVVSRIPQ